MTKEEHIKGLLSELEELDAHLPVKNRQPPWRSQAMAILSAAGVILVFWTRTYLPVEFWSILLVAVIGIITATVYLLIKTARDLHLRESSYMNLVVSQILKRHSSDLTYHFGEGMGQKSFDALGFFRLRSSEDYHSDHYIKGVIEGVMVFLARVNASGFSTLSLSSNETTTQFNGLVMVLDFHKDFSGETFIVPDKLESATGPAGRFLQKPFSRPGTSLVHLDDPEFEKAFAVYASDEVEVRYLLSHSTMQRMLKLRERFGPEIRFCFRESFLGIAIPTTTRFLDFDSRVPFADEVRLRKIYTSLNILLGTVYDLDLTTRIWGKQ